MTVGRKISGYFPDRDVKAIEKQEKNREGVFMSRRARGGRMPRKTYVPIPKGQASYG